MIHGVQMTYFNKGLRGLAQKFNNSRRLKVELLENRRMLAVFTVSNLNDVVVDAAGDAPGTLRQALFDANSTAGPDVILFQSGVSGSLNLTAGELYITDSVVLTGPGSSLITIDATGNDVISPGIADGLGTRVFSIDDGNLGNQISVEIEGLTVTGGDAASNGAGIRVLENLILRDVRITGNTVVGLNARGAGLYSYSGTLLIQRSTISNNSAIGAGAAGGGMSRSTMIIGQQEARIEDSTISGNSATGSGGGIISSNNHLEQQTFSLINSTVSGNSAGGAGGGFYNLDGTSGVQFSTISNNSAAANLGGGLATYGDSSTFTDVRSTIISGNTSTDVAVVNGPTNRLTSSGFNLIGTGNTFGALNALDNFVASGDQRNVSNPGLLALANNGGPTWTHALLSTSLAIDAGDPAAVAGGGIVPDFDQRGNGRVLDGNNNGIARIDVGAFEFPAPSADFDNDGDVDGRDFLAWQRGFGITVGATKNKGDADNNGAVNSIDLGIWQNTYGTTSLVAAVVSNEEAAIVPSISVLALLTTLTSHPEPAAKPQFIVDFNDELSQLQVVDNAHELLHFDGPCLSHEPYRISSGDADPGYQGSHDLTLCSQFDRVFDEI